MKTFLRKIVIRLTWFLFLSHILRIAFIFLYSVLFWIRIFLFLTIIILIISISILFITILVPLIIFFSHIHFVSPHIELLIAILVLLGTLRQSIEDTLGSPVIEEEIQEDCWNIGLALDIGIPNPFTLFFILFLDILENDLLFFSHVSEHNFYLFLQFIIHRLRFYLHILLRTDQQHLFLIIEWLVVNLLFVKTAFQLLELAVMED